MKNRTTIIITALALTGSAWATSPYDTAYGNQWNFMIGAAGDDGSSETAVTSDGTVFIMNRTSNNDTWGSGGIGSLNSGMGAISPLGQKLYGTSLRLLPGMQAPNQNYLSGITAVGNRAYVAFNGSGGQYWTGEDGTDNNKMNVYSVDSSGLASIADRHRLSVYKANAGAPPPLRTDPLKPTTTGLAAFPSQHRGHGSAMRASTMDMIMVVDGIGDFGRLGDFGGVTYNPMIARYNFTTNTLTGPQYQPVLSGNPTAANNNGYFIKCNIDQATGWYYGAGYSRYTVTPTFDPDGVGTMAPMALDPTRTNGIIVAYDATDVPVYALVWNSISPSPSVVTSERINAIAPTNDGSNSVFYAGYTTGDMAGFSGTNANPGVNSDAYIEKRDATGALLWSDQLAISPVSDGIQAVNIAANGDLYLSGYAGETVTGKRDSWLRKYKKTGPNSYTVAWTTFCVNPLDPTNTTGNEQAYDHAFDSDGEAVYISATTTVQWANTTGHVYAGGTTDLMLQKMSPGDFNADGVVDFADVQIAGAATQPGPLVGNDTYDFNRDNDSTFADTTYMITNIMDRLVGDIAQDSQVTDVDNADIGRVIGSLSSGTLYLDGDIDFDGDVDATDLTAVSGAFTGAKTPSGYGSALTAGATLRYRDTDGQVWIQADEATGGMITSFQLENAAGTFVPGNYTDLAGGTFGAGFKNVSANVLGDTDTTLAGDSGSSGIISLGKVFPTGMDLAALQAYLTTAVYTGQSGSGQKKFTLVVGNLLTPYETWASGFGSLTNNNSNIDFDGDGLNTGIEYVLGGDPTVNDAASIAPSSVYNGSGLVFTFRRTDLANTDPNVTIAVAYSTDLQSWTTAQNGVGGVSIVPTDDFYGAGIDQVVVTLPTSLAAGGKLFARLGVSGLPTSLLSENFETSNGGFAAVGSPNDWEWGAPNSDDGYGFILTAGNGGSAKCWGTGLGNGTIPSGLINTAADSILQSPPMDCTGVTTVELTFAAAVNAPIADTIQVIIREQGTDALIGTLTPIPPSANAPWATFGPLDISVAAGKTAYLQFRYVGTNATYCGLYIDDVNVTAKP